MRFLCCFLATQLTIFRPALLLAEDSITEEFTAENYAVRHGAVAHQGADRIYSGHPISLKLQDTDLDSFLRIIAEVSNLNIIGLFKGGDKVTLEVHNTPWDQVLARELKKRNLIKVQSGNVLRIYDCNMLRPIPKYNEPYKGRLISLDLKEPDLVNSLRIIAEVSNQNILLARGTSNKRSALRMIDIPWDQALDVHADTNELVIVPLFGNVTKLYHWRDSARFRLRGKKYRGEIISVDFLEVPISKALKTIAKVSGKPVVGKFPSDTITLQLIDVPWDQVLDLILDDFRYSATVGQDKILISPDIVRLR